MPPKALRVLIGEAPSFLGRCRGGPIPLRQPLGEGSPPSPPGAVLLRQPLGESSPPPRSVPSGILLWEALILRGTRPGKHASNNCCGLHGKQRKCASDRTLEGLVWTQTDCTVGKINEYASDRTAVCTLLQLMKFQWFRYNNKYFNSFGTMVSSVRSDA